MGKIDHRLESLGLTLPTVPAPLGSYVNAVRTGNLLFLSGGLPANEGGIITGTLGVNIDLEAAHEAARLIALNRIAVLRDELGDLDKVARIVAVHGFVQASPDFTDHPAVINGASDILAEIFGEKGRHSRTAVGVASLPLGAAVEIDLIVEVAAD